MLRTDTVGESTLELLKNLSTFSSLKNLRLVGGTALALQLGHRNSIDLDFFGKIDISHAELLEELQITGLIVVSLQNTKNIHIFNINNIKVDIVNYPYNWLEPCVETQGIRLAGLKDIAAMKLSAITNRGTKKDFIDIYELLQHFSLQQQLQFYEQKYPDASVYNAIRSLCYFEDAENDPMPKMISDIAWSEVKIRVQKAVENL